MNKILRDDAFPSQHEIEDKQDATIARLLELTDPKRGLEFYFDDKGNLVELIAELSPREITDIQREHVNLKEKPNQGNGDPGIAHMPAHS